MRLRRACASKEKTSRIIRISGTGWGLKKCHGHNDMWGIGADCKYE